MNQDGPCSVCGEPGTLRKPHLADQEEADRMAYYSCQPCFDAVWAGEN